jgi:hypothetical protein
VEYDITYASPLYFLRKDTLVLKGSYKDISDMLLASSRVTSLEKQLKQLQDKSKPKQNNSDKNLPINKKAKGNIVKSSKSRGVKKDTVIAEIKSNTLTKIVKDYPKTIIIDSSIKISENQLTVGDAMFDKDPAATILYDGLLITQLLSPKIQDWNTFKTKAKIQYKSKGKSQSFNANIRLRKDSVTWASVIVLGELARAILTKDSVMAIDKWNDVYYQYPVQALQDQFNLPINFDQIQDIILGNMVSIQLTPIIAKKSNKGFAIKLTGNGYQTVASYHKDSTLRSVVVLGSNAKGRYSLKSTYDNYEVTNYGKMAMNRTIRMYQNNQETYVTLELQKCEFDVEQEYPFSIPAKFKASELKKKTE